MITMVNLLMVSFKITLITELFPSEKWPFSVVMWVIFDTTDITDPTNRYFYKILAKTVIFHVTHIVTILHSGRWQVQF